MSGKVCLLVSVPCSTSNAIKDSFDVMTSYCQRYGKPSSFTIPPLNVGTLDSLMATGDDLGKQLSAVEVSAPPHPMTHIVFNAPI